jgi:uncharacterized protein GlcG (DUF336 family)
MVTSDMVTSDQAPGRVHDMIEAAVAKGESLGVPFAIAVVDAKGSPVSTRRMAGTAPDAIETCLARATAAMLFAQPTSALAADTAAADTAATDTAATDTAATDTAATDTAAFDTGAFYTGAFEPGGVPVTDAQGRAVGAVGACGGSADQDHEVALAAAAAY